MPSIAIVGIDIHIGSQITELAPYREAARKLLDLVDRLAGEGIRLRHVDLGGGLGIRYRDESPVAARRVRGDAAPSCSPGAHETLLFEPGRRLVGDAGVLLTRVEYLKTGGAHDFAIVDAAMNDLLRPALYGAWHPVDPVRPRDGDRASAGRSSGRSARAPISSRTTARSRSRRATCWRSAPRAPTRWR